MPKIQVKPVVKDKISFVSFLENGQPWIPGKLVQKEVYELSQEGGLTIECICFRIYDQYKIPITNFSRVFSFSKPAGKEIDIGLGVLLSVDPGKSFTLVPTSSVGWIGFQVLYEISNDGSCLSHDPQIPMEGPGG